MPVSFMTNAAPFPSNIDLIADCTFVESKVVNLLFNAGSPKKASSAGFLLGFFPLIAFRRKLFASSGFFVRSVINLSVSHFAVDSEVLSTAASVVLILSYCFASNATALLKLDLFSAFL